MPAGNRENVLMGLSRGRRRLGIAGFALALLSLVLPAFADTPETGADPSVTLTATPSTGLADGQLVTVTGTGFPPNTPGTIRQCAGTVTAPQCDLATTTHFVTTAAGIIPPTAFVAKRIVNTGATTINCGVQACSLVATAGAKSSQHQIRMAGAGTVVPTSSTTTSTALTSTTSTVAPGTTSSTSTSSSTSTTSTSSTTSTTTTSTTTPTSTSTSSTVPTSIVASTTCAGLRSTQAEAIAGIDTLIAAFPQFRDVGIQAREATNAKFVAALATVGC